MESVAFDVSSVSWWDGSAIFFALTLIGVLAVGAWIVSAINRRAGKEAFLVVAVISIAPIIFGFILQTDELDANRQKGVRETVQEAGFKNVQTLLGSTVIAEAPDGTYAHGVIYWISSVTGEVIWR